MRCNCNEACLVYIHHVNENANIVRYIIRKCQRLSTDKKPKCTFLKREKISENKFVDKPVEANEKIEEREKNNYIDMLKENIRRYENNKIESSYDKYASIITWILAKYGYNPFIHGLETIEELKIRILKPPDMIKNVSKVKYPINFVKVPENIKIKNNTKEVRDKNRPTYLIRSYCINKKYDEDETIREEESEDETFDMENEDSESEDNYEVYSD